MPVAGHQSVARLGAAHAALKIKRDKENGASVREREAAEEMSACSVRDAIKSLEYAVDVLGMVPAPNAKYKGHVRQKPLIDLLQALKKKVLI